MEGFFAGLKVSPRRKVHGLCEPCGSKRLLDFPGIRGHKNAGSFTSCAVLKQFLDDEFPPGVLRLVCLTDVDAQGVSEIPVVLGPLGFDPSDYFLLGYDSCDALRR